MFGPWPDSARLRAHRADAASVFIDRTLRTETLYRRRSHHGFGSRYPRRQMPWLRLSFLPAPPHRKTANSDRRGTRLPWSTTCSCEDSLTDPPASTELPDAAPAFCRRFREFAHARWRQPNSACQYRGSARQCAAARRQEFRRPRIRTRASGFRELRNRAASAAPLPHRLLDRLHPLWRVRDHFFGPETSRFGESPVPGLAEGTNRQRDYRW